MHRLVHLTLVILALVLSGPLVVANAAQATGDTGQMHTFIHDGIVTYAAWNGDESQVLTTSEDGSIRLWDVTGNTTTWSTSVEMPVGGAAWSPDETLVVAWTAERVVLLDAATGTITDDLAFTDQQAVGGVYWRTDGEAVMVWAGSFVNTLTLLEGRDFAVDDLVIEHDSPVLDARWNADSTRILTLERAGRAHIWDAASGDNLTTVRLDDETLGFAWNADTSRLLTWGGDDAARIYDVETGRPQRAFEHRTFVEGATWNDDESRVLTWGADETARIWEVTSSDLLLTLPHEDWVTGARWNGDETRILTWAYNSLRLWSADGNLLQSYTHETLINGATFSADETRILSWSWDGTARIWSVAGNSVGS